MKPLRLPFALAIAGAAASCAPAERSDSSACAEFEALRHDERLPAVSKVGDLEVSSLPANPIRIYDPANDGIKGAKGAMMSDTLIFETAGIGFTWVTMEWMSFHPAPTTLTITNLEGKVLLRRQLSGRVQMKPLSFATKANGAASLIVGNTGRESIITRVCFTRHRAGTNVGAT